MSLSVWQFGTLQMFGHDVIIANATWDFENYFEADTKKGADPHYALMSPDARRTSRDVISQVGVNFRSGSGTS